MLTGDLLNHEQLDEDQAMKMLKRLRAIVKSGLGRLAVLAFPGRARVVEQNIAAADSTLLDRIIRLGLICRVDDPERISQLHHRTWAGEQGLNFAAKFGGRFEAWFKSSHVSIVDELEKVLAERAGTYRHFYEIGCGDGQVANYLSTRLQGIDDFVGIDINEQVASCNNQVYQRTNLRFVSGNAADWIGVNGRPRSVFLSNGGVLEYFSEKAITDLLRKIATDLKPALFVVGEPLAPDYDLDKETRSRPYGDEWSFTHNYPHLFSTNGFKVRCQREATTGGYRWLLLLAIAGDGE